MTGPATVLRGGCHCGTLAATFSTAQPREALHPRACDCTFCTAHGAAWLSDPAGTLDIVASRPPREVRQGSGAARFLLCDACGVLVAVVDDASPLRGAVNARCVDDAGAFGEALAVSPRQLSREDKIARWERSWTPAVITRGPGRQIATGVA